MAKKKNYWYVLVMTVEGPKYVTEVHRGTKEAVWDKLEKPLEFGKETAQDLAWALCVNMHNAVAVCQNFEITSQPFYYQKGHFEWVDKEDAE